VGQEVYSSNIIKTQTMRLLNSFIGQSMHSGANLGTSAVSVPRQGNQQGTGGNDQLSADLDSRIGRRMGNDRGHPAVNKVTEHISL
jgi:hypothetical protein